MKKNFGAKTYLYPMPVLMVATYNDDGTPKVFYHGTDAELTAFDPAQIAERDENTGTFGGTSGEKTEAPRSVNRRNPYPAIMKAWLLRKIIPHPPPKVKRKMSTISATATTTWRTTRATR